MLSGCIISYSPKGGSSLGGTVVTITGTRFLGATAVKFGTTPATRFVVNSTTSITAVTPAHSTGNFDITVDTPTGIFTTTKGFAFEQPPTLTSISPPTGSANGGTTVTLRGNYFAGLTSVKFGTTPAIRFTMTGLTTITAVTAAHTAGTVPVTVTTYAGTVTAGTDFTYAATPSIDSFTPISGSTSGGTLVTITGTDLTAVTGLTIGTQPAASYTVTSSTRIEAVTEPNTAATAPVKVITPVGVTVAPHDFTYVAPAPTVSSFTPASGSVHGGKAVIITGTGLMGATAVKFGATTAASFTVTSPAAVRAVTAAHQAAGVPVSVTTAGGTTLSSSPFNFDTTLAVLAANPNVGPVSGGTPVQILGTNLTDVTGVMFGTTTAETFVKYGSTGRTSPVTNGIFAVTKPHAAGAVPVRLITPTGTATLATPYTFEVVPDTPSITSFAPRTGSITGGNVVSITGTGLTGATAVQMGGTTVASFTVTSPTRLTAVLEPYPRVNAGPLTVTTPTGIAISTRYFVFRPPPAPTLSVTSGSITGGTAVVITGTRLTGVTAVMFGTTTAANFVKTGKTGITGPATTAIYAHTKPHQPGSVPVRVVTSHGTGTATDLYTFRARTNTPTITSFTPSIGSLAGGNQVTITGTGFTGATAVKFVGTTAASFTVTSPTTITAITRAQDDSYSGEVTVTTPLGVAKSRWDFRYVNPPTITSLSRTSGSVAGGTEVFISGKHLTGVTAVMFGTTTVSGFLRTGKTGQTGPITSGIIVFTEPHAPGSVPVRVIGPQGTGTAASPYTFVGT